MCRLRFAFERTIQMTTHRCQSVNGIRFYNLAEFKNQKCPLMFELNCVYIDDARETNAATNMHDAPDEASPKKHRRNLFNNIVKLLLLTLL